MKAMTRRDLLIGATATTIAYSLAGCGKVPRGSMKRPNILLLWTDQQRLDTLACYGNHLIKTPNLNRLANSSVVFDRPYCSQPVCTPSRGSVLTGLWPHQHGAIANNQAFRPGTRCLPELMTAAGIRDYATGYIGKCHLGDELYPQHGFDEWVSTEDGYDKWYGPSRNRNDRSDFHHWLCARGYIPDAAGGKLFSRNAITKLPIEHGRPTFIAENAVDFLARHRNQPFVLSCNFLEPHNPYHGPLNDIHDPSQIVLPPNKDHDFGNGDPLRYRLSQMKSAPALRADGHAQMRRITQVYLGMISQVDSSIGAILIELDRLGLTDNTVVIFTSDHGDLMGSHGMLGKSVFLEEAATVPLLIRVPDMSPRRVSQPVSHINLVPTILDLMDAPLAELPGHSLRPLTEGAGGNPDSAETMIEWNQAPAEEPTQHKPPGNSFATSEQVTAAQVENSRCLVTGDGWKLALSDADRGQLYNLKLDPGEMNNLFALPEHRGHLRDLAGRITAWQHRTKDPLILPPVA